MLTPDEFRQLESGAEITLEDGRTVRFVRYRGGKATCVDADGKRVNILTEESRVGVAEARAGATTAAATPSSQPGDATEEPGSGKGSTSSSAH